MDNHDLFSLSQSILTRCHEDLTARRLFRELADDLEKFLGFELKGLWIDHQERWHAIHHVEDETPSLPDDGITGKSVQKIDGIYWWLIHDDSAERPGALMAVGSTEERDVVEAVYEELLPTLHVLVNAVQAELTIARHELLEPPEDVSPNIEEARQSGSPDDVLDALVESAGQLFECDNCRLFWIEEEGRLRLRAESHETGEVGSTLSVDQDPIIQSVLREEKSVIINNLPDHEGRERRDGDIRSFLSVPFRHGDRVLGALNLSSEDEGVYTREMLEQFSAVADNFALVHEITRELANLSGYVEEILANLPVGVISVEPSRDRVRLNPEAGSILGISHDTLSYDEFTAHLEDSLDGKKLMDIIRETEQEGRPGHDEFQLGRDGSHPRTIETFSSVVENIEDRSDRLIAVLNDVTEQRMLSEQVNRAERLAALGELAAGLAHEIKNPLTSIQGFVQLLPERGDDPEFIEKTSDVIGRESRRLNALVDNLVSFAKPQVGSRTDFPLNSVIDDVEMLVQKQLEKKGVNYSLDVPEELTVFGDDQKLKQVMINLALNAVDAMEEGGELTISAGEDDNGFVVITVKDTGVGIPDEQIDQVFNPFFTTKEEGTGLGLAISHRIVEEHGGTIEFDSEAGEGTRVDLTLPPKEIQEEMAPGDFPSEHVSRGSEGDNQ